MKLRDFEQLTEDLSSDEQERLRRVHDLLLDAGPPQELPASLRRPPRPAGALFTGRRPVAVGLAAALALALGSFTLGYFVKDGGGDFETVRTVSMRGVGSEADATGTIELGRRDNAGNFPLRLRVQGLRQVGPEGYYELLLTREGKAIAACGSFKVEADQTSVSLDVGYAIERFDGWVVTAHPRKHLDDPPIVLRS